MRFVKLDLENFRGIKKLSVDFGEKNTLIHGDNGTGKTTIANAISWILTDQPITGEKDFTPKTQGTHDLHHVARLEVAGEGGSITAFAKDFHEVWKKKRGSATPEFSGHVTDYAINGVPQKKKEYEEAIASVFGVNPEKIRQLIMPGYFAEILKPEDRRRILFEICGNVDDDTVIRENKLEDLPDVLKIPGSNDEFYTCDEYKKIATERRRKLNKELETIPERIDELMRGIPEDLPEDDVETLRGKLEEAEKERRERIASFSPDVKREALKTAILGIKGGIEKGRMKYLTAVAETQNEFLKQINLLRKKQIEATKKVLNLKGERDTTGATIKELQDTRELLLEEYKRAQEMYLDDCVQFCPTCKQPLPEEQIAEIRAAFNRDKAERKRKINEQGKSCSKEVIESLRHRVADLEPEIAAAEEEVKNLESQIEAFKAGMTEYSYEETDEYKNYSRKLAELEAKYTAQTPENAVCDTKDIDTIIYTLQEKIGAQIANKKTKVRIQELESAQREAGRNLEQVERGIHLCEEFIRAKVRMVTERINSKFKTVSWLLFKEQINGGLKECCEAMIPNKSGEPIEYKSANTAARINAGLEIVEVLNDHYNTSMPVIIDQAESICRPRQMEQQVIRLIVSAEDKKIRVEGE